MNNKLQNGIFDLFKGKNLLFQKQLYFVKLLGKYLKQNLIEKAVLPEEIEEEL